MSKSGKAIDFFYGGNPMKTNRNKNWHLKGLGANHFIYFFVFVFLGGGGYFFTAKSFFHHHHQTRIFLHVYP